MKTLAYNIQKIKSTTSGSIPSWQIVVKKMETMTDFVFLGYRITEEGMATHSSVLDWRLPKDRGARWSAVHEARESGMTEKLNIAQNH